MGDPWVRIMRLEMQLAGIDDYHRAILDRYTDMIRMVGEQLVATKKQIAAEREAARIRANQYIEAMHDTLIERDLARAMVERMREDRDAR